MVAGDSHSSPAFVQRAVGSREGWEFDRKDRGYLVKPMRVTYPGKLETVGARRRTRSARTKCFPMWLTRYRQMSKTTRTSNASAVVP